MNEYKNKIEASYFNIISVFFLFIFMFYGFRKGIKQGFKLTLFLWSLTVCTTPISSTSILLSFPIKIFTKVPMFVTKFVNIYFVLGLLIYLQI